MIRAATLQDSRSIAELHVASWKHAYVDQIPGHFLENLSVDAREATWRERLSSSDGTVLICEAEGLVKGFISFGPARHTPETSSKPGEIYALYLHPHHQRRGIGSALWRAALNIMQKRSFEDIHVWALDTNTAARRFYESRGCVLDGTPKTITIGGAELFEVRYLFRV